jgi:hypothetical protein
MWPKNFDQRLSSWYSLRQSAQILPLEQALFSINSWWSQSPWQPYYLHWDDYLTWPDPWQLLSDNVYCDLARALGMFYTITMLERKDMATASLILNKDGSNLVQVMKEKYILNWSPDSVVNTSLKVKINKQLTQDQITEKYN